MKNRCNTCKFLIDTEHTKHRSHYKVCSWLPSFGMPSNVLVTEVNRILKYGIVGFESIRWIPKIQVELANKEDEGENLGDSFVC